VFGGIVFSERFEGLPNGFDTDFVLITSGRENVRLGKIEEGKKPICGVRWLDQRAKIPTPSFFG